MATISHIPNPISVSVKTAGYTIPANRYARAVVNVIGSGTFTIAGSTALASTQATVASTGPSIPIGNNNALMTSGTASGGTHNWTGVTKQDAISEDFFLPAGTVINGTGTWRATVEEYGG